MKAPMMLFASLALSAASAPPSASNLSGDFNTGPSLEKEAAGASLNIRFHPCTEDQSLTCATVLDAVEPNGPSGRDVLPSGEPVVGFVVVRDLRSKGNGEYRDGKIAAIDESMIKGKMIWYGIKIDDNFDGTLAATGCLGFICPRKMTWTAVGAADRSR